MVTVASPAASINAGQPAAGQSNQTNNAAIAWQALAYVAGKEARRDDLHAGADHLVALAISGHVDGLPFSQEFAGRLTVGHDGTRSSSVVPNVAQVVAAILAKLNPATREAVCRDLPAEFAANGSSLPELSVGQVKQAEALLAALRSTKQGVVRGSVKCEYELRAELPAQAVQQPSLVVVG